jgi:predicted RNA-binding Zn-ribbon protein involved in translation (DUF1610 family)
VDDQGEESSDESEEEGSAPASFPDGLPPVCRKVVDVTPHIKDWAAHRGVKRCSTCRLWLDVKAFTNSSSCPNCRKRSKRGRENDDEGGGEGSGEGGRGRKSIKA